MAKNDPKQPHTSTTRRLNPQSVYSVHNYKQPQSIASSYRGNQSGIAVSNVTAQPTNYKHQRTVEQPTGSVSVDYVSTTNPSDQNYKRQLLIKPAESVNKVQEPTVGN